MTQVTSAADGSFGFPLPADGQYKLTATKAGHTLTPESSIITVSDQTPVDVGDIIGGEAVSLPWVVNWEDGDISEIVNETEFGFVNSEDQYNAITNVSNPMPSTLSGYNKAIYAYARSPENISANGVIDLGANLDLHDGLRVATWIRVGSSSNHYIYPVSLSNGFPNGAGNGSNSLQVLHDGGQNPGRWSLCRMIEDGNLRWEGAQASIYPIDGNRWNLFLTEIDFDLGKVTWDRYSQAGTQHRTFATQYFTPHEPVSDLRYVILGNGGSTSTWTALVNCEQVHFAGMWIGSKNDDWPTELNGAAPLATT